MIVDSKTPGLEPGVLHGAVNQIRTGDLLLGKETLYQLSYYREQRHSKGATRACQRPDGATSSGLIDNMRVRA